MPNKDADVVVIEEAVDGRCHPVSVAVAVAVAIVAAVSGFSMLRLVVAMLDGSNT